VKKPQHHPHPKMQVLLINVLRVMVKTLKIKVFIGKYIGEDLKITGGAFLCIL